MDRGLTQTDGSGLTGRDSVCINGSGGVCVMNEADKAEGLAVEKTNQARGEHLMQMHTGGVKGLQVSANKSRLTAKR